MWKKIRIFAYKFMNYFLKKKIASYLLIASIFLLSGVYLCNHIIENYAKPYLYNNLVAIPPKKIGLLLGTSHYLSKGKKNLYFEYRIEAAAKLFHKGKIQYILASGDNHKKNYNEPIKIKQSLIKAGVPKEAIYLDYAGFSTYESIVRCKKVFQEDDIIIISQEFHNERALYIAKVMNMKAIAFNAKDPEFTDYDYVKLREVFARVKAVIDVHILKRKPKFLGQPVLIGGISQ